LQGTIAQRLRELFAEIAEAYDITIEEMEVSMDHVQLFCSFPPVFPSPPRLSISQVITRFTTRFESLSARAIFKEHPQVKKQLWGGEFWEDGYFARTVGDKVTAQVIKKDIRYHRFDIIVRNRTMHSLICSPDAVAVKAPSACGGVLYFCVM
jgi:putative transposase